MLRHPTNSHNYDSVANCGTFSSPRGPSRPCSSRVRRLKPQHTIPTLSKPITCQSSPLERPRPKSGTRAPSGPWNTQRPSCHTARTSDPWPSPHCPRQQPMRHSETIKNFPHRFVVPYSGYTLLTCQPPHETEDDLQYYPFQPTRLPTWPALLREGAAAARRR